MSTTNWDDHFRAHSSAPPPATFGADAAPAKSPVKPDKGEPWLVYVWTSALAGIIVLGIDRMWPRKGRK